MKIKYEEGLCSDCGLPKLIVQKSLWLCATCNGRRLSKIYNERRKKRYESGEQLDRRKLNKFYREVWDACPHACFETGQQLFSYHKWHVHHILEKENYPELAFCHEICVLLTLDMHALWHSIAPSDRRRKMPNTYKRYVDLLKKYDHAKYESEINSGITFY